MIVTIYFQGDPLSPFLFTLVADSFSQIISNAEAAGIFGGFQVGSEEVKVSYLQLADDTLLLMEGEHRNMRILKSLIQCFILVSVLKLIGIRLIFRAFLF